MIEFLGYSVAWVIGLLILSMIINSFRASKGGDIQDGFTAFMQGLMFGPIGIIASFSSNTLTSNRGAMASGGIVGTIIFILLFYS